MPRRFAFSRSAATVSFVTASLSAGMTSSRTNANTRSRSSTSSGSRSKFIRLLRFSDDRSAAVDDDRLPCDVAGGVAGEEDGHTLELPRRADAGDGIAADDLRLDVLDDR